MTPKQVIEDARRLTFDSEKDQQTWDDPTYLMMMNEGLNFLYANYSEVRVDSDGAYVVYSRVLAEAMGDTLWLDDIYFPALVSYVAYRFFTSDAIDTRERNLAREHYASMERALDPRRRR